VYFYSYFAAVKAIANITTKGHYPVYDVMEGNVKLRNFALTFNLTTSNDYSWKPI
jgi:transcriptional regulator of nitric oxide reductase